MDKYICTVCDYVYDPEMGDPENGIEPGTSFEDLPEDWVCPLCGVGKENLRKRLKTLSFFYIHYLLLLHLPHNRPAFRTLR